MCASEYVGLAARTLGTRVDEHVGVSYRTGARCRQQSYSALRDQSDICKIMYLLSQKFIIFVRFPNQAYPEQPTKFIYNVNC